MKKRIAGTMICLLGACALIGCGSSEGNRTTGSGQASVNDVIQSQIESSGNDSGSESAEVTGEAVSGTDGGGLTVGDGIDGTDSSLDMGNTDSDVADSGADAESTDGSSGEDSSSPDLDLTALSSTMVYSEVYNIMTSPQDYVGKKIKMNGTTAIYHDENDGNDYYACVIADATACCSQGIEFVLDDKKDYPAEGSEITVVGTFSPYQIMNNEYYTLKGAELLQ